MDFDDLVRQIASQTMKISFSDCAVGEVPVDQHRTRAVRILCCEHGVSARGVGHLHYSKKAVRYARRVGRGVAGRAGTQPIAQNCEDSSGRTVFLPYVVANERL